MRFGPYGFRATWHHLLTSAGIHLRLDKDPRSLGRAVDELEQARRWWRSWSEDYAARRRREKAAGLRQRRERGLWHTQPQFIAYCPDFEKHPTERLAVVVQRVIDAHGRGADLSATCPACGHGLTVAADCRHCGVAPDGPSARHIGIEADTGRRWREVWRLNSVRPSR